MTEDLISIVVVPRERFSDSARSLESLYTHTRKPFELIYVDGGSPRSVRHYLDAAAARLGFRRIRTERYLSPNEARNIGWRAARGKYVVFVDNDVVVTPGWLEPLVECAEEKSASVVAPVICIGAPGDDLIHMANGELRLIEDGEGRRFDEVMVAINERFHAIRHRLQQCACDFIEFHCVLVRREMLERLGGVDEEMRSTREHIDFSLSVRAAGGAVFFEPRSYVTHIPPWCSFKLTDLPYYLLRWNNTSARASVRHFASKWSLSSDTEDRLVEWIVPHRRVVFQPIERLFPGRLRFLIGKRVVRLVAYLLEATVPALVAKKGIEREAGFVTVGRLAS